MRIARTAALILAMSPLVAVAQRGGGRGLERKPSPATSATSAPSGQPAASGPVAAPVTGQSIPAQSSPRPNTNTNNTPVPAQPAAPQPVMRPVAAVQPSPTTSPVVAPAAANFSTSTVPAPATMPPASTPEPTATVRYVQGQLTVTSQNASLGTVLKLISAKTGATIDVAPELQNEPVVAQIGPSAIQDVMSALLDSPKIDYIIMGSGAANGGLQRILVRTRQSFGRTEFAANRAFQPPQPPAENEFKLNENAPPVAGVAKPQTALTQEQLMANWQKVREEKRLAEIEQQRKDRENEAAGVEPPPQPEPQTQPQAQPNGADNPPMN